MYFFDKRILTHFNFEVLILILPIVFLSHTLIYEASQMLAHKQMFYFSVAFVVFVVVFFFPIRRFMIFIPVAYWIGIVLLISVLFFGIEKLGAARWLSIPIINITIQPSEIFKPIFVLMLGYLVKNNPPPKGGYNLMSFLHISFYILLPFILIVREPDLGTALVLLFMGYGVLFLIGINYKIILTIFVTLMVSSPLIYTHLIKDYQKKRIKDFLSKKPSYHTQQSIIAIGSGGLFGKNSEEATQTQLKFLPIATSDFIFAFFVERHGFIGSIGLILLYMFLIIYLLILYQHFSDDYLINVVAASIALLIFLHMSINILMVIGFAPVVGLPLPLFSYGGSSFVNFIIMFAILENLLTFRFNDNYSLKNTP